MILKTAVIHFVAAGTFGHLNSLLKCPHRRNLHAVNVFGFMLFPLLPVIQLSSNITQLIVARIWGQRRPRGTRYIIRCILGMHATYGTSPRDPDSWPLFSVQYDLQRSQEMPCGLTWCGRFMILLAVLLQAVLTLLLLIRRTAVVPLLPLEVRNGFVAVGGGLATAMSMGVLLLNTTWTIELPDMDPTRRPIQSSLLLALQYLAASACLEVLILGIIFYRQTPEFGPPNYYYRIELPLGASVVLPLFLGGFFLFVLVTWQVRKRRWGKVDYVRGTAFALVFLLVCGTGLSFVWLIMAEPMILYVRSSQIEFARQDVEWRWEDPLSKKMWGF